MWRFIIQSFRGHRYLLILTAMFPVLLFGFPAGEDWIFELQRIREFARALRSQFVPFWGEGLYGGYGASIFLFYSPLFLSVATFVQSVAPLEYAAGLAVLISFFIAYLGMGTLTRILGMGSVAAFGASAVYLLSSYFLGDLYLRNALAEFLALCIAPFVLAGLFRILRPEQDTGRGLGLFMVSLAAVVLAHNPTALVILAMSLVAPLFLIQSGKWRLWFPIIVGVMGGLVLSAFFWVPAFFLRSRMRLEDLQRGKFQFHQHFGVFPEMFQPGGAPGFVIPLVVGLMLLSRRGRQSGREPDGFLVRDAESRRIVMGSVLGMFLLLAMNFSFSRPVWESLPLLRLFQFPSRLLGPAMLLTAIVAGLSLDRLTVGWNSRRRLIAGAAFAVLVFLNGLPVLMRARPLAGHQKIELRVKPVAGTTVYNEYVPRHARAGIWQLRPARSGPLTAPPPEGEIHWVRNHSIFMEGRVRLPEPQRVSFARWFVPEWEARIDGKRIALARSEFGNLELELPAGNYSLEVVLRAPFLRRALIPVSLGAFLIFLIWALIGFRLPAFLRGPG